ncbi:MAG: hypothetical protein LUC39_02465 [Clostridiales bacterium]|nr:hypothetical protein [Clostridiales bacterium]
MWTDKNAILVDVLQRICKGKLIYALCLFFIISVFSPAVALDVTETVASTNTGYAEHIESYVLENGFTIVIATTVASPNSSAISPLAASQSTNASKKQTVYDTNGSVIAIIQISGTFEYDGTSVSVTSKSLSRCDVYDGWSFSKSAFNTNDGTIVLTGKLSKLLNVSIPVNVSLTCDKNGNIS